MYFGSVSRTVNSVLAVILFLLKHWLLWLTVILKTVPGSVLQTNRFLIWETQNIILWNYPWKVNSKKTTWQVLEITIQRGHTQKFSSRLLFCPFNFLSQFRIYCGHVEFQWIKYLLTLKMRQCEWSSYTWYTVKTKNDWIFMYTTNHLVILLSSFLTQGQWSHEFYLALSEYWETLQCAIRNTK